MTREAVVVGIFLLAVFVPSTAAYEPGRTYPVKALKEELRGLWDMLEEGHPGLDRYTAIGELKKIFDAAGNGLTGPLTSWNSIPGSCRSSLKSRTGTLD